MTRLRFSLLLLVLSAAAIAGCDSAGDTGATPEPQPTPPVGWQQVEEVPSSFMETMLVSNGTLYVGGQGRVYTTQDGVQWSASAPVPDGYEIGTLTRTGGRLFAGTYQGGVYEATSDGTDWTPRNEGLSGQGAKTVRTFAVRDGVLYAGTEGASVFRQSLSAPNAQWQPFRAGIPSSIAWSSGAMTEQGGWLVLGAGANGTAYVNKGEGQSWQGVAYDTELGRFLQMYDLLATDEGLLAGGTLRLYRSPDRGESWNAFDLEVGELSTTQFARTGDSIFALAAKPTVAYLYHSEDDGRTWGRIDEMRGVQAFDIAVHQGRLYMAQTQGLWSIPVSELVEGE